MKWERKEITTESKEIIDNPIQERCENNELPQ